MPRPVTVPSYRRPPLAVVAAPPGITDPGGAAPAFGSSPPCNTGDDWARVVHDFERRDRAEAEQRSWVVSCDKLRLMWSVGRDFDPVGVLPVPYKPVERPGRKQGSADTFVTPLTFPGFGGETIWCQLKRYEHLSSRELRVEFNPNLQGSVGMEVLARYLRLLQLDPDRAWVERVDVAHDCPGVLREWFRLDAGRHHVDYHHVTARGPQTERAGYTERSKRKVKLYDKRAERMAVAGIDLGTELLRFELEAHSPFELVGQVGGEAADVRLAELGRLAWPACEGWGVREFRHRPHDYPDPRDVALACMAHMYGTRAAETAARVMLSGSGSKVVDRLRFMAWREVEPSPAEAYRQSWPGLVASMRADLGARAAVGAAA